MKLTAGILLFVWSVVMIQPAFAFFGGKSAYAECGKQVTVKPASAKKKVTGRSCDRKDFSKPVCGKMKCNKPENSSRQDDNCKGQECNPSLGCSSGNFFVHHHSQVFLPTWFEIKQKTFVINDNRIIRNMSECFHPPEMIS